MANHNLSTILSSEGQMWKTTEGIIRKVGLLRACLILRTLSTKSKEAFGSEMIESTGVSVTSDALTFPNSNKPSYYLFDCKSKGMPTFAEAQSWTDVSDNPDEITGYAYAYKSEQLEQVELQMRTPLQVVYNKLLTHMANGDVFDLVFEYDDTHETNIFQILLPNCCIVGLSNEAGENGASATTTVKILAEGGIKTNMPKVISFAR